MISTITRKLARARRDRARGPLATLLHWCAAHAMRPLAGLPLTEGLMATCTIAVELELRDIADRGALAYFGIADAFDLGSPPVRLFVFDDGEPPYGKVMLEVDPLVAWIFAGGARAQGWRRPGALTLADLGR